MQELYDEWLANGKHEYTAAAWNEISNETIANAVKSCRLALAIDGSDNGLISCFKKGKKC